MYKETEKIISGNIKNKKIKYGKVEDKIIINKKEMLEKNIHVLSLSNVSDFDRELFIKEFIDFPKILYKDKQYSQNPQLEMDLMKNKSVLNKLFKNEFYLVKNIKTNEVLARIALFKYFDRDVLYFGLFESIEDTNALNLLLEKIEVYSKSEKVNEIIGPINASFWTGYRFKTKGFNLNTYFGEPINLDYYQKLFKRFGFNTLEKYHSFIYDSIDYKSIEKHKKRYDYFINKGYEIKSTSSKTFVMDLKLVFNLLNKLYSKFKAYTPIDEESFLELFKSMKYIKNDNLIKLAFLNGQLKGFLIAFDNLEDGISNPNNSTIKKILNLLRIKFKKKEFIFTYLGVEEGSEGLALALAYKPLKYAIEKNKRVISALISDGKVTQNYGSSLKDNENYYEYELLHKMIR